MDILFLAFGPNIRNHYQANFCILTLLKQQQEISSINVYTDYPEFYNHLGSHVRVVPLTQELLQEWKGKDNYLFRAKIKAIEHLVKEKGQNPVMFLDTDTFIYENLAGLKKQLQQNVPLMHENEGRLSQLKSKTMKRMWSQLKGISFGGVTITTARNMWNSGVVALPAHKSLEAVQLALQVCDDMTHAKVKSFNIEQFAIAVALEEVYEQPIAPAERWVGHYWPTKNLWNKAITNFFLESRLKNLNLEQDIQRISDFDFRKIPLRQRVKNTRLRMMRFVDRLFPIRDTAFAGK